MNQEAIDLSPDPGSVNVYVHLGKLVKKDGAHVPHLMDLLGPEVSSSNKFVAFYKKL